MTPDADMNDQKRRIGRPSKLTPELQDEIVKYVRVGNSVATAALLCGVERSTVFRWLALGRGARPGVLRDFFIAMQEARAHAEAAALAMIRLAAGGAEGKPGDWRAAAWYLEHCRPRRFRTVQRTELTGKNAAAIEIERSADEVTDEELAAIAAGAESKI
jgi:hypothetical protein